MKAFPALFVYSILLSFLRPSTTHDWITPCQSIRDGETMISAGGIFKLGFFSPGNSENRYLGIWYSVSNNDGIVWVANRESPLKNHQGVFKVTNKGILVVLDSTNTTIWSSKTSRTTGKKINNATAQLLDSGNLVVKDGNVRDPNTFLWQSFDYPSDTLLPSMKIGWDLNSGIDRHVTSWKSMEDPSQGQFSGYFDHRGLPQLVAMDGDRIKVRLGSWNGLHFTGMPWLIPNPFFTYKFVMNEKETYFQYEVPNNTFFLRFVLNPSGVGEGFKWMDTTKSWEMGITTQADVCQNYAHCGVYSTCDISKSPVCSCLDGFKPKFPNNWNSADWSGGCVRETLPACNDKDGFQNYKNVKLPNTCFSWFDNKMSLKECEEMCLKNCSCNAYANLDVRNGGSGCLLWLADLVDMVVLQAGGQDIYIRQPSSVLDQTKRKLLDWHMRHNIICGIAKGLLYLHEDSRLRIIHRDLKASNVLLDNNMNPKISDFGLAKTIVGDQIAADTKRIVGTYGYMPPEYAGYGQVSVKTDVFSFGVLLLEIVSGKKSKELCNNVQCLNLLGHAWRLWIEDKPKELIDEFLIFDDSCTLFEVLRCIHVGLLCVQQSPEDRPNMSSVVLMLSNDNPLPSPRQPGYFTEKALLGEDYSTRNVISCTVLEAR
ncbi:hypothetical protein ACJW30_01G352200 [Castanea mollissima]